MRPFTDRLTSIDALRGAAALAVVLFHTRLLGETAAPWQKLLGAPIYLGHAAVYLFFVVSGFCIHQGVARRLAAGASPHVEFLPFWKRRLRRLYPPYLAALLLYALVAAAASRPASGPNWWVDLGAHVLLLHNLDRHTAYSFCGVFWTLAIEEQLYLAYFLLLPWRRQWGWGRLLVALLAVRCGWYVASQFAAGRFPGWPTAEFWPPHWLPWALGALSAEWSTGAVKLPRWTRNYRSGLLALAGAALLTESRDGYTINLIAYPLWALGFFTLLNSSVQAERAGSPLPRPTLWLAGIGAYSYSLYLTHGLILDHLARPLAYWLQVPVAPGLRLALVPLCLLFAWCFHQLIERRFLNPPVPLGAADEPEPTTR
ncbi:MAG: acyltransferase [Armatimonadetes bacterium]|jgi:peptidoglycan/LPS O-acetylase OafA/YrhL|nr:acyltransferase [Armatimonadota bacterium]